MAVFTTLRKSLIVLGLITGFTANAQYNWDIGFSLGASNYLGDIGGNVLTRRDFVADMKLVQTKPSAGVFARYKLNPWLSLKGNLSWARLAGDDKLTTNPARNARNLNFRNDVIELAGVCQFNFYDVNDLGRSFRYQDNFCAYIGLGAGVIYHNPKAYYNGEYVALRPLRTENYDYTMFTAVVPVSGGFTFTFDKQFKVGFDLSWRTTFTDYLDDVSTDYADPSLLPSQMAIELANRTDELDYIEPAFAENFTPGSKRGDASHNDSYLTSTLEISYAFMSHSDDFQRRKHQGTIKGQRPTKIGGHHVRRGRLVWKNGKLVRVIRLKW